MSSIHSMTILTDLEAIKACYCLPGYVWSEYEFRNMTELLNIVIITCIHKYPSTWYNTFQGDQGNDLFDWQLSTSV